MTTHESRPAADHGAAALGSDSIVPAFGPRLARPVLVVHVDPAQRGRDVLGALHAPDGTFIRLVVGDAWPVGDAFGAFARSGVSSVVVQIEAASERLFRLWEEALTDTCFGTVAAEVAVPRSATWDERLAGQKWPPVGPRTDWAAAARSMLAERGVS